MSDADKALDKEVAQTPGIKFTIEGAEFELPKPFTMRTWLRLLMAVKDDGGSDAEWWVLSMAGHAADVVCWTTGLTLADLEKLPGEELERVLAEVADQLGEELADARPFSPKNRAMATISQAGRLAAAMAKAGGTPAS